MIRRATAALALIALATPAFADSKRPPKKDPKDSTAPAPAPEPPKPLPTGADKRRIIGILDVRIDGAPPEVGAQFQRDLEAQVDIKHYFLAPRGRMKDLMSNSTKWSEGCVVGPCLHDVKVQTGADVVLLAALTGSGTSFGWVVTLVRTDTGSVLGQKAERCDVCTVSEALSASTLAVVALLTTIPDQLPPETVKVAPPIDTHPYEVRVATAEHHQRTTGIVLTIAGAVVAAAGAALYYSTTPHPNYGLATLAVGGGAVLGGLVVVTF